MARSSLTAQLASQILDHIRTNNLPRGQHLPTQALADACRVSRAPIASAMKFLENMGVVRFESNRGYFLAADAKDLIALKLLVTEAGDEDDSYFEIAEDRLSGKLPAQVTESELMRLYHLPRSRLLKILGKIAQEGWIERLPGHGWEFRPILTDRTSYEAGYRFRATIESGAVLDPNFRIDHESFRLARTQQQMLLTQDVRTISRAKLFKINSELHEMIVGCGGNEFYVDALRRVNRLRRLIEYRLTVDRSRLNRQCREHIKLLDLLESGDLPEASAFLRRHIEGASTLKSPGVESQPAASNRKKKPA